MALGFWTYVVLDWHSVCAALGMVAEDGRTDPDRGWVDLPATQGKSHASTTESVVGDGGSTFFWTDRYVGGYMGKAFRTLPSFLFVVYNFILS